MKDEVEKLQDGMRNVSGDYARGYNQALKQCKLAVIKMFSVKHILQIISCHKGMHGYKTNEVDENVAQAIHNLIGETQALKECKLAVMKMLEREIDPKILEEVGMISMGDIPNTKVDFGELIWKVFKLGKKAIHNLVGGKE